MLLHTKCKGGSLFLLHFCLQQVSLQGGRKSLRCDGFCFICVAPFDSWRYGGHSTNEIYIQMDWNSLNNNSGTVLLLKVKGHGKFLGYLIITCFQFFKELLRKISMMGGCCWIFFGVCGFPSIETSPDSSYRYLLKLFQRIVL